MGALRRGRVPVSGIREEVASTSAATNVQGTGSKTIVRKKARKAGAKMKDSAAQSIHAEVQAAVGKKRKRRVSTVHSTQRNKVLKTESVDSVTTASFRSFFPMVSKPLLESLHSNGYFTPTPVQAESLPMTLRGQDVIAVAATGSGKTVAFMLPILMRISNRSSRSPARKPLQAPSHGTAPEGAWTCAKCSNVNWPQRDTCNTRTCRAPRPEIGTAPTKSSTSTAHSRPAEPLALVLAPTRELAQQISNETCKFNAAVDARAACIYGGVPKGDQARALTDKGADIVIATPGRCLDFLEHDQFLGQPLSVRKVACLVLDEADRMLEAGFFPAINKIMSQCPTNDKRQSLFFTATWPRSVQDVARSVVNACTKELLVQQQGKPGELTANKGVAQRVEMFEYHSKKLQRLVEILNTELVRQTRTCIVFCKTQKRCDWLVQKLEDECELAWSGAIHAGKVQHIREELLATFRSLNAKGNDQRGVLVATNVAARGLDIPGVPLVIVFDFTSVENYVHQIGRTARAGAQGRAITFYVSGDGDAPEFVSVLRNAGQTVPPQLVKIANDDEVNATCKQEAGLIQVRQGWKDAQWAQQRRPIKQKKLPKKRRWTRVAEHSSVPFLYLLDNLTQKHGFRSEPSRNPIFQAMLNYRKDAVKPMHDKRFLMQPVHQVEAHMDFDIMVDQVASGGTLITHNYCTDLFKPRTAEVFAGMYLAVLRAITTPGWSRVDVWRLPSTVKAVRDVQEAPAMSPETCSEKLWPVLQQIGLLGAKNPIVVERSSSGAIMVGAGAR